MSTMLRATAAHPGQHIGCTTASMVTCQLLPAGTGKLQ
ncbi:hypothetical protein IMCC9480_1089 [Oxalobacteraceae bacterium IMCC9480]|nr:hypothetical protein IMCC9480_1089 [Oxalobacteraceae bacterium IMCC9480]